MTLDTKVFHRILEEDTNVGDSSSELKKGQIRWDAFEKVRNSVSSWSTVLTAFQAMKRIGFGVCQTAGSSVRFDPPAKNARPITFHRVRDFAETGFYFRALIICDSLTRTHC